MLAKRLCGQRAAQRGGSLFAQHLRFYSSSPQQPEVYDVVCVGGGPAGLSLLNGLRASPTASRLKVALVESQDLSRPLQFKQQSNPEEYSNRCSSLTPASVSFLESLGAWQHVDHSRVQPFEQMKVWDGVSGAHISFDWTSASGFAQQSPSSGRTIAYMTENNNLVSALLTRAHELGNISLFDNSRVDNIELGKDTDDLDLSSWPVVTLSSGQTLAARLLVGADGPNSLVRTFAGIESRGWDYERHGVVATLRLDDASSLDDTASSHATAYQRFLPTGPAALLPLPNGLASLVWTTLPSRAAHLKKLPAADVAAMVNAAFRLAPVDIAYMHDMPAGQADEVAWREQHTAWDAALVPPRVAGVQPGSVASFPLRMRHADTYVGERVALLGDAAHTVHPLAGQGLNQGQADVQALVAAVEEALDAGADIGSTLALEGYNARRYAANHVLLGVVDKLHKIYSVESGPLVPLRSWGLSAVDALAPLKGFFMGQAAGGGRV